MAELEGTSRGGGLQNGQLLASKHAFRVKLGVPAPDDSCTTHLAQLQKMRDASHTQHAACISCQA